MDVDSLFSVSPEETFRRGEEFAQTLHPGDIIAFYGDLGAGKTEFIKGICQAMNVGEIVSSPTYTIVNQYMGWDAADTEYTIYHIDLYRIQSRRELDEIGLADLLDDPSSVKLIEWPQHAGHLLPDARCDIRIFYEEGDDDRRRIQITDRRALVHTGTAA